MDVVERLSLEAASADDLIALTHRQRYVLAAELCAGLRVADVCCGSGYGSRILSETAAAVTGVDNDQETVEEAARAFADVDGIDFVQADAAEFLERALGERHDAIVILEGLEHLEALDRALDALARHAASGMRIVASLPNSQAFAERNPHHITEFDQAGAVAALDRLGEVTYLYQYNAEGSLIAAPGEGDTDLDGRLVLANRAEPGWCSHVIGLVNFEPAPEAVTRMRLDLAPEHARYMVELEQANRDLERANRELWRTNTRLWRERLGVGDSAAAAEVARRKHREEMPERVATTVGDALIARPIRFGWRMGAALLKLMPAPVERWLRRVLGRAPKPR